MSTQTQGKKKINMPQGLLLVVDPEIAMVIEFMQSNVQAKKLIRIAKAVNDLAIPVWGHLKDDPLNLDRIIPISFQTY
jgi:hypothetical protein